MRSSFDYLPFPPSRSPTHSPSPSCSPLFSFFFIAVNVPFLLPSLYLGSKAEKCQSIKRWCTPQSTYMPRVPQCRSPRPNWDPLAPTPASECVPPPTERKGRGHTRLLVVQIRTTVWKAYHSVYSNIVYVTCKHGYVLNWLAYVKKIRSCPLRRTWLSLSPPPSDDTQGEERVRERQGRCKFWPAGGGGGWGKKEGGH